MALHNVTINAIENEMVGDEFAELWLRRGSDAWELYDTVAIENDGDQDFVFLGLEADVVHVVQTRSIRDGRYRAGYLSADPDAWPEQSRFAFRPGADPAAAPTIAATSWERTAADAQNITVTVTPHASHLDLALQLFRDGELVATVEGPHVGDVDLVDEDPPLAQEHEYTARHVELGVILGDFSAPASQWSGPDAPTGLAEGTTGFYSYEVTWDAPVSGAVTRVQDDYLCSGNFANRGVTAADETSFSTIALEKESGAASNGNVPANFQARARHEVTSFSVTDVSAWTSPVAIEAEMAADETAFNSCP